MAGWWVNVSGLLDFFDHVKETSKIPRSFHYGNGFAGASFIFGQTKKCHRNGDVFITLWIPQDCKPFDMEGWPVRARSLAAAEIWDAALWQLETHWRSSAVGRCWCATWWLYRYTVTPMVWGPGKYMALSPGSTTFYQFYWATRWFCSSTHGNLWCGGFPVDLWWICDGARGLFRLSSQHMMFNELPPDPDISCGSSRPK